MQLGQQGAPWFCSGAPVVFLSVHQVFAIDPDSWCAHIDRTPRAGSWYHRCWAWRLVYRPTPRVDVCLWAVGFAKCHALARDVSLGGGLSLPSTTVLLQGKLCVASWHRFMVMLFVPFTHPDDGATPGT